MNKNINNNHTKSFKSYPKGAIVLHPSPKVDIEINFIPYKKMRYETVGDYYFRGRTLVFDIADTGNEYYNALILQHELAEYYILKSKGIDIKTIDRFDKQYEKNRVEGDNSEPGDSIDSPYRNEHCIATGIERTLAGAMNISWKEYEDVINNIE